jgi:hypothetical protein
MTTAPTDWQWGDTLWQECNGVVKQLVALTHTDPQLTRYQQAIDHLTQIQAQPASTPKLPPLLDQHGLQQIAERIDQLLAQQTTTSGSFWQQLQSSLIAQPSSDATDLTTLKQIFATVYQQREQAQQLSYHLQQAQQQAQTDQNVIAQRLNRVNALINRLQHALTAQLFVDPLTAARMQQLLQRLESRQQTLSIGQVHGQQQQLTLQLIAQQQQAIHQRLEQSYQQLHWISQTQQLSQQQAWRERLTQSRQGLTSLP